MLAGPEAGHLVYTPNRQFNYVKIKIEKEDSEDNRLNTFNSEATVGKLGTLKLRLLIIFKYYKKKICYRPLRELLSSNSDRLQSQNSDLEIPKKEKSKGDHHCTEYFEADDDKDKINIKKEDSEDNRLSTFNSKATVGKLGTLKFRL